MVFLNLLVDVTTTLVYVALVALIWEVLTRRFLVEKIFSLILVFVFLSYALLLAGLEFLSLVILLLYVGAIAVLFLFVVMILNPDYQLLLDEQKEFQMESETQMAVKKEDPSAFTCFLLTILSGLFTSFVLMYKVVIPFLRKPNPYKTLLDGTEPPFVYIEYTEYTNFINGPFTMYNENMKLVELGDILYNKYGIAVFVIGALLLVSMISSILLCVHRSLKLKRQNISKQSKRYK